MSERLVHPSQIEYTTDPDDGAYTYAELQAHDEPYGGPLQVPGTYHEHVDEQGLAHRCYHKCRSWVKIAAVVLIVDVLCELVTFMPIHRLFEMLGWIS